MKIVNGKIIMETGEVMEFEISNTLDAILETPK